MATFDQREKGKWRARVRKKGHKTQTKTFVTKAQAERWAKKVETEMDDGVFRPRSDADTMLLKDALDDYDTKVSDKKKSGDSEKWRINLWKNSFLANTPIGYIRGSDIAKWRDERLEEVSSGTCRNDLALLSHLFSTAAKEWGMEDLNNPVNNIRKPPPGKSREFRITDDQEGKLLKAAREIDGPIADIIILAIETAMRRGEIANLKRADINKRTKVARLTDTKNGEQRDVPLSTKAIEAIEAQPAHITGHVFKFGEIEITDYISRRFRAAADAAEMKDHVFHDCRHEATSRFFEMGFSDMEVSSITGHKTLQMLKRYTHMKAAKLAQRLA